MAARLLQIFKPGQHRTTRGDELTFSESDLAATAAAYDPARSEAPLVVGHPASDDPAYGWVKSLQVRGGALEAVPDQVEPAFAEMVNSGRFKKISAAFYPPSHPGNPAPGVYYLRHVGFLGAAPPAVKGLRTPTFAADEPGLVEIEFAERSAWPIATIVRGLREWLIEKFTPEDADRVVPNYLVDELQAAAREDATPSAPLFSEPASTPDAEEATMSGEAAAALAAREAALASERERLDRQAAEFAEREQRIAAAESGRLRTEVVTFVEGLVSAGRVLPRDQAPLVELLVVTPADRELEFAEGDGTTKTPAQGWLREFLERLPTQVEYAERAGTDGKRPLDMKDPNAIARAAVEFQEAEAKAGRTVTVSQAVTHVTQTAA